MLLETAGSFGLQTLKVGVDLAEGLLETLLALLYPVQMSADFLADGADFMFHLGQDALDLPQTPFLLPQAAILRFGEGDRSFLPPAHDSPPKRAFQLVGIHIDPGNHKTPHLPLLGE
jgi:hypothetical protein